MWSVREGVKVRFLGIWVWFSEIVHLDVPFKTLFSLFRRMYEIFELVMIRKERIDSGER
jgi:hypothetical protein